MTTARVELGTMSAQRRQKRMGPAPFASVEDLSDEVENSPEPPARLPNIREDAAVPTSSASITVRPPVESLKPAPPNTPRIDISRASSSSHHEDSRDSTPERELFEPTCSRLGLAFNEDGAMDLRSSTEELDFHDKEDGKVEETETRQTKRKDSQSSELGFLSISGRTSRLSSIGSQGSRVSNASHLSVTSGMSRSPSPHKMLLETSFCGAKTDDVHAPNPEVKDALMEQVLLSRKQDPTEAVLAEGISIESRKKIQAQPPPKEIKKQPPPQPVISDVIITVDSDSVSSSSSSKLVPGQNIVLESGVEYTYIPLKGPLPKKKLPETSATTSSTTSKSLRTNKAPPKKHVSSSSKHATAKYSSDKSKQNAVVDKNKQPQNTERQALPIHQKRTGSPEYIRIKLKPDHMYDDNDSSKDAKELKDGNNSQKPISLDLNNVHNSEAIFRHESPKTVKREIQQREVISRTPSPSVSRKSSFTSLFRKDASSPEWPGGTRSRSKSRERDDKKNKSVFAIFKSSKKSSSKHKDGTASPSPGGGITPNLEFTFSPPLEKKLECDSTYIRIPLHSPSEQINPLENLEQENVFSTNLGNNNEIFSTRLPNESRQDDTNTNDTRVQKDMTPKQETNNNRNASERTENRIDNTVVSSSRQEIIDVPRREVKRESRQRTKDARKTVVTPDMIITTKEVISISSDMSLPPEKPKRAFEMAPKKADSVSEVFGEKTTSRVPEKPKVEKTPVEKFTFTDKVTKEQIIPKAPSKHSIANKTPTEPPANVEIRVTCTEAIIGTISEPIPISLGKSPSPETKPRSVIISEDAHETLFKESAGSMKSESTSTTKLSRTSSVSESENDESEREPVELKKDGGPETRTLVLQQDSFEDELPYIPTTLPQERSVAVPIVPVKQRTSYDIKTCPIERPRSTTPISLSCLEDYCDESSAVVESSSDKLMRISLPKEESSAKMKNPMKWTEFAQRDMSKSGASSPPPPPLPPRSANWINFEEIPERRKPPKRIQTIPSSRTASSVTQDDVVYSYVNPEDCKCECHEPRSARDHKTPAESKDAFPHLSS